MKTNYNELTLPNNIRLSINQVSTIIQEILGNHLKQIILYGSYARGDYGKFSDVDLLVLTDLKNEEIIPYRDEILDKIYDIGLENNIIFMPLLKNQQRFYDLKNQSLYTENVNKEGVLIYE